MDGKEIRMRERLGRSGWKPEDMTERLGEMAAAYYACHGAILEVVVSPRDGDRRFSLENYPYFADFDPKKRELYEIVTETGEAMSRTYEDVNVRLGQTTLASHEVLDKTTLAGSLSASYMGVTASGSVANEASTKDLSSQSFDNVRTSDAAREARETFSHTTQLSQMYHQLDSYHLGSNRASFFVLPRPHVIQSPATFVNGPREIEGIQEFMLVVVRPKEMEDICVEAYLETAHLVRKPIPDWGRTQRQLPLHVQTGDTTHVTGTNSSPTIPGYIVDTDLGGGLGNQHGPGKGYTIVTESIGPWNGDYTFTVGTEFVTIDGWVEGFHFSHPPETIGCVLDVTATVHMKKRVPGVLGYEPGLLITGRAVCSCAKEFDLAKVDYAPSVVYEKTLGRTEALLETKRGAMSIHDANQLIVDTKREMLRSLSSADRYPRGAVGLLDSQLFSEVMGQHIQHAERGVNTRVLDWPGVDRDVVRKVAARDRSISRARLLEMPLPEQVEQFGISFADAVKLRRSLADLAVGKEPIPVAETVQIEVPLLTGLQPREAQATLAAFGLEAGPMTVVDSPSPANSVLDQKPEAGARVDAGSEIAFRVASGLTVRLPEVVGVGLAEAACRLRGSGLRSEPNVEGKSGPDFTVAELVPPAGTLVTPQSAVTIRMKRAPRR